MTTAWKVRNYCAGRLQKDTTHSGKLLSMMTEKASHRMVLPKMNKFVTYGNPALRELGTEKIRQFNILALAIRKFVKKDPQLGYMFPAVCSSAIHASGFLTQEAKDLPSEGWYIRTVGLEWNQGNACPFFFAMNIRTSLEALLFLTAILHMNAMMNTKQENAHRGHAVGTSIGIYICVISKA